MTAPKIGKVGDGKVGDGKVGNGSDRKATGDGKAAGAKGVPAPLAAVNVPLARAGALVAAQKFGEAEAEIVRALSGAPGDLRALNLLALVRFKLGRLEDAHATYADIARAAPDDAGAHRNLGLIALKLGRPAQARPELETAVRLAPADARAWSYLGYVYAKQGDTAEAAAAFRRAGQEALAVEIEQAHGEEAGEDAREEASASHGPVALAPPLPPLTPRGVAAARTGARGAAGASPHRSDAGAAAGVRAVAPRSGTRAVGAHRRAAPADRR